MTKPKIVLGLSGGVDSAVSARLLQENYTVIALYLSIGPEAAGEADARAVAEELGIEFHTMNISEALERHVKAPFASDYLSGRTPLPCARCNPLVKFPSLLALAKEVGADYISTGHYARVEHSPAGRTLLKKGQPSNDQSYMLAQLPLGILQKVIFPLGNSTSPTPWRFVSSPTTTRPPGWSAGGRPPPTGTSSPPTARCWAGMGASTATLWARAGGWGSPVPTGTMCPASTPKPIPLPSPTAPT